MIIRRITRKGHFVSGRDGIILAQATRPWQQLRSFWAQKASNYAADWGSGMNKTSEAPERGMPAPYSRNLDILTALITQLAVNPYWSRTLPALSADLSLPESQIKAALEDFSGLFRVAFLEGKGWYSLHARAALRKEDEAPELRADILKALLEYVLKRADAEISQAQFNDSLKQTSRNATIAAVFALVAAVASIVAAIVSGVLGH